VSTNRAITEAKSELEALRKGAPHNTKLSVSRKAKRTIKPSTYSGTGNLPLLVMSLFPKGNRVTWKIAANKILTWCERNNSGIVPDAHTCRMIIRGDI